MKHRTNLQKSQDCYDVYKCLKEGKKVKRSGAKDGSIATRPVVTVADEPEKIVLAKCGRWLSKHNIFCNRNNVGSGRIGESGYYSYGIKDGGDIIGLLPGTGRHFEIECKAGKGGRLSKGQQERMLNIRANGGIYHVVHGIGELEYYFEDLV